MPRPNQLEALSPISLRAKVQKASKETRHLQSLFRLNAKEIKQQSSNLSSAATIMLRSLNASNPWYNITNSELVEKVENHAEALLSDSAFVQLFKEWPGIDEIRSFFNDKKWWKRRRITTQNCPAPRGRPHILRREDSFESTRPTRSVSLDTTMDNGLAVETPVQGYPRTAKKGTSILRPRFSMSHTPGTPTRQMESQSSDGLVESDTDFTDDDELQLVQLPADVSQRIKNDKIATTRKRKSEELVNNNSKRSHNNDRVEVANKKNLNSIQFGRGRPPLTTVLVTPSSPNFF